MEKRNFVILVIGDDPADVEMLRRLLGQIDGWKIKVLACNDVVTGSAEASRCQADLIFLDYLLGEETGLEAFHQIRKRDCTLPVIMFNGHNSEKVAVEAMKVGVSDYLVRGLIAPERLRLIIIFAVQKYRIQQKIEEKRNALLDAERQRVMMESVTATCHHFAGPLTAMLSNLQMFARVENIEEPEKRDMLDQCLKAAEKMKMILNKFQQVQNYRTRPFLEDIQILDIGLGSIYGTPELQGFKGAPEQQNH
jgi:DNA-binding response OmpR family regulator